MERSRRTIPSKPSRRVTQHTTSEQDSVILPLPHIAELIDYGGITVGEMNPVGCVAVARAFSI
jgi:hypothetical protein